MSNLPRSKTEVVVRRYSADHVNDKMVIYFITCYINGDHDEGIMALDSDDMMSDDDMATIAPEYKPQSSQPTPDASIDRWDILQYVYTQNRKQFCIEMRNNYNMKKGLGCKIYQRINTEITEGLQCNMNVHYVKGPCYPMDLHLNIFSDKSYHKKLSHSLVDTNWFGVQQISDLTRNCKYPSIMVMLNTEIWVEECKKSFEYTDAPLIPVVIEKDNRWIEWVKIVNVHSNNIYVGDVGVSFKYNACNEQWSVQSIYFDCDAINNQHQLSGMRRDRYVDQLKKFNTNINKVIFID